MANRDVQLNGQSRRLIIRLLLSGLCLLAAICTHVLPAEGADHEVNIIFSCEPVQNVYDAFSADELIMKSEPKIETTNLEVKKQVEELLPDWQAASKSVATFVDVFQKKLEAKPFNVKKFKVLACGANCLKAVYSIVVPDPVSVTSIVIYLYNPRNLPAKTIPLPEWINYISDGQNIAALYKVEVSVPILSEPQKKRLAYLAGQIAMTASKMDISPGKTPDRKRMNEFETAIVGNFGLELTPSLRVVVSNDYKCIEVHEFPLIDGLEIHLTNWRDRDAELRKESAEAANKYQDRCANREKEIRDGFMSFLPDVPVFTTAQLSGSKKAWEKKSKTEFTKNTIESRPGESLNNVLVLEATEPPRIFTVELSLGLRYSTEKNFQGTASIAADNLLNLNDKLKFEGALGNEADEAAASWTGTISRFNDPRYSGKYSLAGSYATNNKAPLGQISTTLVKETTWDAQISVALNFDSFLPQDQAAFESQAAGRKMTRFWTGLSLGGNLQSYQNNGNTNSASKLDRATNSVILGGVLGLTQDWRSDVALFLGYATGRLRANAEEGIYALWGEDNFTKLTFFPEVEIFFGPAKDRRDFFLRLTGKVGFSCGTLPYAALFRLGGKDGVRGLESTELTGDAYLGTSEEMGVRFSFFVNSETAKKIKVIDLNNLYLKFFHDWMQTRGNNGIPDPTQSGRATVNGFGAAVEMNRITIGQSLGKFAFGYAYSPDSELNRGGAVYVELRQDF